MIDVLGQRACIGLSKDMMPIGPILDEELGGDVVIQTTGGTELVEDPVPVARVPHRRDSPRLREIDEPFAPTLSRGSSIGMCRMLILHVKERRNE